MIKTIKDGIIANNPIFKLVLGLCPTLAVTTSVENAIGMGIAVLFVLLCSNLLISMAKSLIPESVRIPCYIIIIATFVTIVDLVMKAYFPPLSRKLGIFIPLIVVNCIILGRAEAFASKNGILASVCDAIGMGIGYTLAALAVSVVRESLGSGTLLGHTLYAGFNPPVVMSLAPGAFFTLGIFMGVINFIKLKKTRRSRWK